MIGPGRAALSAAVAVALAACGSVAPCSVTASGAASVPVPVPVAAAPGGPGVAADAQSPAGRAPGPSGPALSTGPAAPMPGEAQLGLPGGARVVALTFDDGPDPRWTPQVLALLDRFRVRATFCLIGRQVVAHPGLVARIVAGGHRLCNHTFDHDEGLGRRPVSVIDRDIQAATAAMERAVPGAPVGLFRAPGGSSTAGLDRLLPGLGLRPLGWSVDPDDWRRPGVAVIVARVLAQIHPGSIILLHDGGGDRAQTVAALRQLLPALAARGYLTTQP